MTRKGKYFVFINGNKLVKCVLERVTRERSPFFCVLSASNGCGCINVHLDYLSAAVGKFRKFLSVNDWYFSLTYCKRA